MKLPVPSPKASGSILLIIILSTSIIVYSNYNKQNTVATGEITTDGISVTSQINRDSVNIDSDGDGLLDWEESLWGTDPNNPDTDSDGTNDYDEIKANRNPLVAGPNDENIDLEDEALARIQSRNFDEDGLTNQVALTFADTYFNSRDGRELTNEQKNLLVNQLSEQTIKQIKFDSIYTINSISTFDPINNDEKLIRYTDLYLAKQVEFLNLIVQNYENTNYEALGNEVIKKSNEIMSIETPQQIANLHLELANNYYQLGNIIKTFEKEEEDPLYAMLSLRFYENTQIKIRDINILIGDFLEESGIILGDNGIKIQND